MGYLIGTVGVISLIIGVIGGLSYLNHPFAGTSLVRYNGGKFWLTAFICAVVLYLK